MKIIAFFLKPKNHYGFTLVELIVVITILVILGTIAFIQLGGFASSARDGRRVSDMSNITQSIELSVVTQGSAPLPTNPISYTGGSVTIQVGIINNTTLPKMSGDFSDPVTKAPYNYSVFGNGLYYQLGIDFENPLSFSSPGQGGFRGFGIDTAYADSGVKYSKLSGSYKFDPSLPSLFFLTGAQNTASGGIFSPDVCFVMNNVSTNTFGSTSGCKTKKDMNLKDMDSSLVGYWDMETTSGGLLKDLSGNGNNGTFTGSMSSTGSLTGGIVGMGRSFNGNTNSIIVSKNGFGSTEGSISALVKLNTATTALTTIFDLANTGYGGAILMATANAGDGTIATFFQYGNGIAPSGKLLSNKSPVVFQWHQVIITYGTFGSKIYINGILNAAVSKIPNIDFTISPVSYFGSHGDYGGPGIGGRYLDGSLDDVKIYNRALSDNEIKQQAKIVGF